MTNVQASLIAILAVILGPTISLIIAWRQNKLQLKVTEKQFNAMVTSQARLSWIEKVREEVAGLVSLLRGLTKGDDWQPVARSACMLELLLNPDEEQHKVLLQAVNDVIVFSAKLSQGEPNTTGEELRQSIAQLLESTQPVLRQEWSRVKKGV